MHPRLREWFPNVRCAVANGALGLLGRQYDNISNNPIDNIRQVAQVALGVASPRGFDRTPVLSGFSTQEEWIKK
jgi:hypothetical protein